MRYLEILASYVPQVVVRHLLDDLDVPTPSRKTLETVCLFCDVSGFTALSERMGQVHGEKGAEYVAIHLNRYLKARQAFAELCFSLNALHFTASYSSAFALFCNFLAGYVQTDRGRRRRRL